MKTTTITDKIWSYLRAHGLTENGAAGLMGNLYSESGCEPQRVEELLVQRYDEDYKKGSGPAKICSGYSRPVNTAENIKKNDELYLKRWKDGSILENEFLSPRQYTGKAHQYAFGLVQWTTKGRKKGLLDLCNKKGTSIEDLDTQLEYLIYELEEKFPTVLKYLKGNYSLNDCSDIVLTRFEAPANADAMKATRRSYSKFYLDSYKGKQNVPKLTRESFLAAVSKVYQMAHDGKYTYGDSQGWPPCSDKVISCDRLEARALYDLGFTDQPHKAGQGRSGICVDQMDEYLPKFGFVKSTKISDVQPGSVVVVNQNGKPAHAFTVVNVNGSKCDKYDCGSQQRIEASQPFKNVAINEWPERTFGAVYNIPEEKKEVKTIVGFFEDHIGEKEYNGIVATIQTWFYGSLVRDAWCATSTSYAAYQAGIISQIGGKNEGVSEMMKATKSLHKSDGRFWEYGNIPSQLKRHDIIFFKRNGSSHVAHAWKDCTYTGSGYINVIGGNQSDMICKKDYKQANIQAVYRPKYDGTPDPTPTKDYLSKGDTGDAVKTLQSNLNRVNAAGLVVDGSFGDLTEKAVKNFQKKYGLVVDGCCGKATQAKIAEELSKVIKHGVVTAYKLNVRSGPGTQYPNITGWPYLNSGNEVDVMSTENGWAKVRIAGKYMGYVSMKYLVIS